MSALLIDGHPMVYQPQLAKLIGLQQAVVLQQIHYWTNPHDGRASKHHDGFAWVYKTNEELGEEVGLSKYQTRRALVELKQNGLVVAIHNPHWKMDHTLWLRIDHEAVCTLTTRNHTDDGTESYRDDTESHRQYQETTNQEITNQQTTSTWKNIENIENNKKRPANPLAKEEPLEISPVDVIEDERNSPQLRGEAALLHQEKESLLDDGIHESRVISQIRKNHTAKLQKSFAQALVDHGLGEEQWKNHNAIKDEWRGMFERLQFEYPTLQRHLPDIFEKLVLSLAQKDLDGELASLGGPQGPEYFLNSLRRNPQGILNPQAMPVFENTHEDASVLFDKIARS